MEPVARSFAASAAGDTALALSTAQESVAALSEVEPSFPAGGANHALAAARLADGDAEGASEALLEAGGGGSLALIPAGWRPRALELHTRILLALDRPADAAETAAAAQDLARRLELRSAAAYADRGAAAVVLAREEMARDAGAGRVDGTARADGGSRGERAAQAAGTAPRDGRATPAGSGERFVRADAATLALRSAASFGDIGAPVEAALSRALAGRAYAAAGDTAHGAAELERAAAELERCEALGHRDACERELRRMGRRTTYRRTRAAGDGSAIGSLTERELQIARLVVDRRTNAEIAAELYLSTKTVETHLRNLFHKLGVSSRVEVARVVERAEPKGVRPR